MGGEADRDGSGFDTAFPGLSLCDSAKVAQ